MDDSWAEGLVIDDYFVISKEAFGAVRAVSLSPQVGGCEGLLS